MKSATRMLLLAAIFLTGGSAMAQTAQVTFQVDLSDAVLKCRFDRATDEVQLRGTMNDWSAGTMLTDPDGDNVYSVTLDLAKGSAQSYKFFATLGATDGDNYENDFEGGNRMYTVTDADTQTLPVVMFNKTLTDGCGAQFRDYEVSFTVDMSVAKLRKTTFDPTKDVITLASGINGWSTTADTMYQDFLNPDLYSTVVKWDNVELPAEGQTAKFGYKFVIGRTPGSPPDGWESISPDPQLTLTGKETDTDGNGRLEIEVSPRYFDNVTPDEVFTTPATVIFEVDMRPAYYYLADNGRLPNDTQTGEPVTTFNGGAVNGPVAGASDGLSDWATWGPGDLGQIATRLLKDDGTQGDRVAGDSVFSQTFSFQPGTPKTVVGKIGTDGYDNEATIGGNTYFRLGAAMEAGGRLQHIFGAARRVDGRYTDQLGPMGPGSQTPQPQYDPYIMISSPDSLTATVVRRGGEATGVEDLGGKTPGAFALTGNFPNPFAGATRFTYTLPQAQHVTVRVFDTMGRQVATLVDGFQAASTYEVTFAADNLPSGVYLYRVEAEGRSETRQMTVVR